VSLRSSNSRILAGALRQAGVAGSSNLLGKMEAPPDLKRGWRFCRFSGVVFRSAWLRLLVPDDGRFSLLFGRCCSEVAPNTLPHSACEFAVPPRRPSGASLRGRDLRAPSTHGRSHFASARGPLSTAPGWDVARSRTAQYFARKVIRPKAVRSTRAPVTGPPAAHPIALAPGLEDGCARSRPSPRRSPVAWSAARTRTPGLEPAGLGVTGANP
jgi:hypothetical protein